MLGRVRLFEIPYMNLQHTRLPCSRLSPGVLLKLVPIESVMPSNHLILCHHLILPSAFPRIRGFSNESALCSFSWPKFWSFSFSISLSNEYSGLISFSIDWTLNSLLQHHSSKASVLRSSIFFMVQLSHPYMTTGKTIALTLLTFKTCNMLWSPRIQRSNT